MRLLHLVLQAAQRVESASVTRAAASSPDKPSSAAMTSKACAHIVARQRHDLGAAVGQLDQQPVGRQHAEGLAQRRARHAQPLAQLALVQPRAGRQIALDDQGTQPLGRRLGQSSNARSGNVVPSMMLDSLSHIVYKMQDIKRRRTASMRLNSHPSGRHFLQIPGPTNVPDRILRAMDYPTIDHRGPEFNALAKKVLRSVRQVFQTKQPVIVYPASGTGAWEAALVNTLSPGDLVLMWETGHFASLWKKMADKLGIKSEFMGGDWRAPRRSGGDRDSA